MLANPFDIAGKTVFITGAGRGIGRGIAEVLAAAGADVAINALGPRYVVGAAEEIAKASGRRVIPVLADMTRTEGVAGAVEEVTKAFGRIDILINNLGDSWRAPLVPLPGSDMAPHDDDAVRKIIDLNLTEAILTSRAVGPAMLERRAGKVINIASWSAARGGSHSVIYTTAKTALTGFTRALALEWAPFNVQVNAIAPGMFPDDAASTDEKRQRSRERAKMVPLGRAGELNEVGYLALYLASRASDYMTGQTIYLDGGLSL